MPLSAIDAISPAFQHTKKQLLEPFRFWQWTRLALVGLLTGELGSSGGCNVPSNFQVPRGNQGSNKFLETAPPWEKFHELLHGHPALIAGLITAAIIFTLLFWVLMIYLNSHMRFVLFDSIIMKDCHIREYWRRRRDCGRRFFRWQLVFGFCSMGVFIILLGIPLGIAWMAGWLRDPSQHLLPLVLGGVLLLFLWLGIFICVLIFTVMTKDFVVPYMVVEDVGVLDGWRRLWPAIKGEKSGYAGYIGMKIVLTIGAGIIFGIITFIILLIIVIPLVIVGVLVGVIAAKSALTWNVMTVTLVVVAAIIGFAVMLYLISLITVPVAVFFPAYAIHFLASRYPRLDALLHPAPPAPPVPPVPEIPSPMPPFLPPEPSPLGS